MKSYFVLVETFYPVNKKAKHFNDWAENLNCVLIQPSKSCDNAFDAFLGIIKQHCEALDKEIPSKMPFKVDRTNSVVFVELQSNGPVDKNVARFTVKEVKQNIEVTYDEVLGGSYLVIK